MKPERLQKIKDVVRRRQLDLTVVLENVRDPHNIGAVIRSCDSIGIREIFVLYTESALQSDYITIGKRTSAGSRRWVDVHYYIDAKTCFDHIKNRYKRVLSTHLDETAASLYNLDLTQPTAFLFGNEHDGLSQEALTYSDGNFVIPQMGMASSLNISVACAVTLYETFRQRQTKQFYDENNLTTALEQQALLEDYLNRQENKETQFMIKKT
ncbi:MAG: RNA methyltransferase [Saprospiraceae bacterium]|nr:RNA methyltransferase [Saprospiraceae bacterium]